MKYDKDSVKNMLCKAIDNIPNCAIIEDCYTEHSFASYEAYIKVNIVIPIENQDEAGDSQIEFHNAAHEAFNSGMGFIS
ncbi:MAG: hypothetical protein H2212_03660 [Ruminococcus sp.]|nr:hypothetical protein [Ruminococcus sp.]